MQRDSADNLDKKSELANKLYNDLSAKIDDVDASLQKETKKTRSDLEKISKDIKSTQTKLTENNLHGQKLYENRSHGNS